MIWEVRINYIPSRIALHVIYWNSCNYFLRTTENFLNCPMRSDILMAISCYLHIVWLFNFRSILKLSTIYTQIIIFRLVYTLVFTKLKNIENLKRVYISLFIACMYCYIKYHVKHQIYHPQYHWSILHVIISISKESW